MNKKHNVKILAFDNIKETKFVLKNNLRYYYYYFWLLIQVGNIEVKLWEQY